MRSLLTWAFLALTLITYAPHVQAQGPELAPLRAPVVGLAQSEDVLSLADGTVTLSDAALALPGAFSDFQRYGMHTAEPVFFTQTTDRIELSYRPVPVLGGEVRVDVRGSLDGQRWLPWVTDLAPGSVIGFDQPIRVAQYRITLLAGSELAPGVRDLTLRASNRATTARAAPMPAPHDIAPTFRVRATRMGMVGGRTANGWIIPPRARFVSLPSVGVLSSRGGNEYQVRLTYRDRSVVVPVYDVGPYSTRDDYWNVERRGFPQLERGWPMDHAAFYEGFNGQRAEKGFVRFPTAVDVGDGAWLDDLGIVGDQAELEITFLWLGQDPAAGRPVRDPAADEQIVDELGGDFWHNASHLGASAVGCGMARHAYWASNHPDPNAATVVRWQPQLPSEAEYDLFVHVPVCPSRQAPSAEARYLVQHRDGITEVVVNQQSQTGWVHLGRFPFNADASGFIQLGAVGQGGIVWFDQAKWVAVR
ncbi:MAG: hypothetical protein AB4911_00455 [Oscillochloridaceae bacterium umkhey_bin13]